MQMLQSCESDYGFRQLFVQMRTTLVNQKSDSIKVKFDYERQYNGNTVFHHNFTLLPGKNILMKIKYPVTKARFLSQHFISQMFMGK